MLNKKMEYNSIKCRTCWEEKETDSLVQVTESWTQGSDQTIKDIILFCVSTLSIQDDHYLCKTCIWELKFVYHFIDRCLKTEEMLRQATTGDIQNSTETLHKILEKSVEEGKTIKIIFEDEKPASPVDTAVRQELQEFLNIADTDNCMDNDDGTSDNEVNTLSTTEENPVLNDHSYAEESQGLISKYPQELVDTMDFVPEDLRCVVVKGDMPLGQQIAIKKAGINILNLSQDPDKKKRVIYLSRDLQYLSPSDGTCKICKKILYSRADFVDHWYMHRKGTIPIPPDVEAYSCKDCPGKFSDIRLYSSHCRVFHNNRIPIRCPKCSTRFSSSKMLQAHMEYFKEKEMCVYSCPKCEKEFGSRRYLENHLDNTADAPSCDYKVCKTCKEKFTKEDFKEHQSVHPNYVCPICGKSYPTAANLCSHKKRVHSGQKAMCQICGLLLGNHWSLWKHTQLLHTHEDLMCDKCPKHFKNRLYLRRHMKLKHGKLERVKQYVCETCGKAFKEMCQLRQHQRVKHDPPRFICEICKEAFPRKEYYLRHLKRHCEVCKKVFRGELALKVHLEFGHDENGVSLEPAGSDLWKQRMQQRNQSNKPKFDASKYLKPCVCRICGQLSPSFMHLRIHYKTHLKIRDYTCEKCNLSLQTEISYKRHIKRHEDPNYEFSCNICHAYTSSHDELEDHMLKHTEKKYQCEYCDEKFGRRFLVYDHEATVHKAEYEKRRELYNMLISEEPIYGNKDDYYKMKGRPRGKFDETLEEIIRCLERPPPDPLANEA